MRIFNLVLLVALLPLVVSQNDPFVPDCAISCWENTKYVSKCPADVGCLCGETNYQNSVFQCIYSQCDTAHFGAALHYITAQCFGTGHEMLFTAPPIPDKESLRRREAEYARGVKEYRSGSLAAFPAETTSYSTQSFDSSSQSEGNSFEPSPTTTHCQFTTLSTVPITSTFETTVSSLSSTTTHCQSTTLSSISTASIFTTTVSSSSQTTTHCQTTTLVTSPIASNWEPTLVLSSLTTASLQSTTLLPGPITSSCDCTAAPFGSIPTQCPHTTLSPSMIVLGSESTTSSPSPITVTYDSTTPLSSSTTSSCDPTTLPSSLTTPSFRFPAYSFNVTTASLNVTTLTLPAQTSATPTDRPYVVLPIATTTTSPVMFTGSSHSFSPSRVIAVLVSLFVVVVHIF